MEMVKIDRNVSELRQIVCKDIILILVRLFVLLCKTFQPFKHRVKSHLPII